MNPVIEILKKQCPPIFLVEDAVEQLKQHFKAPLKKLQSLESKGELIRLKKGTYTFRDLPHRYVIAGLLYQPSYLSFESALSFYSLIPERVDLIQSVTQSRSTKINTPIGTFHYHAQQLELYAAGMSMRLVDQQPVFIATPEKALLDTLHQHQLKAKNMNPKEVWNYVVNGLRIDDSELFKLDGHLISELVPHYRNMAPRKFLEFLNQKKETPT